METWKEFDHNSTTHSVAHHLMTIYDLLNEYGYARVTDVAKRLNITRGSASLTIKSLKDKGLVGEDENRFLNLSEQSRGIVEMIKQRRIAAFTFFTEVLGISERQAEIDACKIEHLLSYETYEELTHFIDFTLSEKKTASVFLDQLENYRQTLKRSASARGRKEKSSSNRFEKY